MNLFSRMRVAIHRWILPFLHFPKPFSFIGADSSLAMCRFIAGTGAKRVMLITDGPLFKLGLVNPLADVLTPRACASKSIARSNPIPAMNRSSRVSNV